MTLISEQTSDIHDISSLGYDYHNVIHFTQNCPFVVNYPQFKDLMNHVADMYQSEYKISSNKGEKFKRWRYWMKRMVIQLIISHEKKIPVCVSLDKIEYNKDNHIAYKYDKQFAFFLSYTCVKSILEFLLVHDFIVMAKGYRDKNNSLRTKIAPTEAFISLVEKFSPIATIVENIKYDHNFIDYIELHGEGHRENDYVLPIELLPRLELLKQYNELLAKSNILVIDDVMVEPMDLFDGFSEEVEGDKFTGTEGGGERGIVRAQVLTELTTDSELVITQKKQVKTLLSTQKPLKSIQYLCSIFNRNSFECGGRFYCRSIGDNWQTMPSETRKYITIDNEATIELDYSSLHLNMIKDIEGIRKYKKYNISTTYETEVWQYVNTKFYEITLNEDSPLFGEDKSIVVPREIVKYCYLVAINASNEQCVSAIVKQKVKGKEAIEFTKRKNWPQLCKQILKHDDDLQKYLCSDFGIKLQRMDSNITEYVLRYFTNRGILVLPVHDSYIIARQHAEQLKKVMQQAYWHVMNETPPTIHAK